MGGEKGREVKFRQKRDDTTVGTIEDTYGVNLNARRDMLLGNLLEERGFDSLSQLVKAYRGHATTHARKRRLFLSFHHEDRLQVNGFRLMARNPHLDFDFNDSSIREAVNSSKSAYIRTVISEKIRRSSILVCLIVDGTAWRDWVEWEISKAFELRKGICGIRLKGARGSPPVILRQASVPVASWDMDQIIAAIECAAARRS